MPLGPKTSWKSRYEVGVCIRVFVRRLMVQLERAGKTPTVKVRMQKNMWPSIRRAAAATPERLQRITIGLDIAATNSAQKGVGHLP